MKRGRAAGAVIGGLAGLLVGAPVAGASIGAEVGEAVAKPATNAHIESTRAPRVRRKVQVRRGAGQAPILPAAVLIVAVALLTE
jgi:uncharacterized membrane protein